MKMLAGAVFAAANILVAALAQVPLYPKPLPKDPGGTIPPFTGPDPATAPEVEGLRWVAYKDGNLTDGFVVANKNEKRISAVCRTKHKGGLHPGGTVGPKCVIGWGGKEVALEQSEILVTIRPYSAAWVKPGSGKRAIIGGAEGIRQLAICRGAYKKAFHSGKVVDGKCNVAADGAERTIEPRNYEILVRTAATAK